MDELRKVYESMRHDDRWPDEITADSLKKAFYNSGCFNGLYGEDYWAGAKYLEVGEPHTVNYTWARAAKQFREWEAKQNDRPTEE